MGLPTIPYDEWFDSNYQYIPYKEYKHNPLDDMPIATYDDMPIATNDRFDMYGSSDCDDAYNIHQKMYDYATMNGSTLTMGGSENAMAA
tara:strand:- start:771 stop:1037 length:267 start_codon:yes stop_codon:yes gene_type:complete